jgi:fatty acid synthase, animal type
LFFLFVISTHKSIPTRGALLSKTGESRPFDENAFGYVKSEGIGVLFLQKRKDSKRNYAEVVQVRTSNDGFKEEGYSYPSTEQQQILMEKFYDDLKIDPSTIEFVEAHSTGTKVGDPQEILAIDQVFCSRRSKDKPLLVGSVKSNTGHCEAAAGVASIAKVLMIFEHGEILPNINLDRLRLGIPAFQKERIKVVTERQKFNGDLIPINSFGIGGANAHILLRRNSKEKVNFGIPRDDLNRLVMWSGRTEKAVETVFDDICQRPLDEEFIALLQNCQMKTSPGNNWRGFGIFGHDKTTQKAFCGHKKVENFKELQRPIVFVYSGMGSQWPGMLGDLMKIPVFAESINRSHEILLTKNMNLKEILQDNSKGAFDNAAFSAVGIVAIEVALTDVMTSIGVKPDYIIGHSVGEVACAYADGCSTAEETILTVHARGVVQNEAKSIEGGMAAVALHHTEVQKILPDDLDIACHNGISSTTVSGPVESVRAFIGVMEQRNIFAREVASSGVAFHSRYIQHKGERFLQLLKQIIRNPRKRSSKWLSSAFCKSLWSNEETQFSSAEYQVKNLLSPVLFEEVCSMLPANCLAIELGPHCLLQSILKMNLKNVVTIGLMQRGETEATNFLLKNLGR